MRDLCAPIAITLLLLATPSRAEPAFGNFDRPLETRRVDLGPSESSPEQRSEVRCHYFSGLMVKEIDEREVGDAQLSMIAGAARPPCRRADLPGEQVIPSDVWSGYFAGVKAGHVIFAAADGVNGAMGFALFRAGDPKPRYIGSAFGALQFQPATQGRTLLRFKKMHVADCSVPKAGAACAESIARATGVAAVPVSACRAGYAAAKRALAAARCEADNRKGAACIAEQMPALASWDDTPSVLAIPVEITLADGPPKERPTGPAAACHPAD